MSNRLYIFYDAASLLLVMVVVAALFATIAINAVLFPDCSRTTHDCFLIQHAWGVAHGEV